MHDPSAACPRCDYDLQGQADAWVSECPLRGTCPECGLDYAWRDVLRPQHAPAAWSFEHASARSPLRLAGPFVRSAVRTLRPPSLWQGVPMPAPVRWKRLAIASLLLMLSAWFVTTVIALSGIGLYAQLRRSHFASVMQSATSPATNLPANVLHARARWFQNNQPVPPGEYIAATWKVWAFPYKTTRLGYNRLPTGPYPSLLALTAFLAVPVTFALLPFTLMRRRVRPRHLARAAAYGAWLGVALAAVWPAISGIYIFAADRAWGHMGYSNFVSPRNTPAHWSAIASFIQDRGILAWLAIVCTLGTLWWGFAARDYLRLPRPWLIAFLLTAVSILAVAAASFFIPATQRDLIGTLLSLDQALRFTR